jgi:hypothetical protein
MRTEHFEIPYPGTPAERKRWNRLYGLNAIYAGKHWSQRNKDKTFWHYITRNALQEVGIKQKTFDRPVRISFWWNSRLDLDNEAYMRKMIIDSLHGWLIENDSKRYVRELRDYCHDRPYIAVEVRGLE